MDFSGIGGLIIVIADIYAIMMVLQSRQATANKLVWSLVIILLPLVGVLIWYFAGPGKKPF